MEPDALEEQRIEPLEFRANGNRVWSRNLGPWSGSGIELDIETWAVWTLDDDGLITRVEASSFIRRARPSKPPGSRSRRCRRRTSRLFIGAIEGR